MKRLIITGDDFGASSCVNEAVESLHQAGLLTQASLLLDGPSADEAIRIANRNPTLLVGLHLCVADRRPARAGLAFSFLPAARNRMRKRVRQQFDRFTDTGFPKTYWDGHMHLHLHPSVMRAALPIAADHAFRATRLVRDPNRTEPLAAIFHFLSRIAKPQLDAKRIAYTDRVIGLSDSGRMTTGRLKEIVRSLAPGKTEIYFHPGAEPGPIEPEPILDAIEKEGIVCCTMMELCS